MVESWYWTLSTKAPKNLGGKVEHLGGGKQGEGEGVVAEN